MSITQGCIGNYCVMQGAAKLVKMFFPLWREGGERGREIYKAKKLCFGISSSGDPDNYLGKNRGQEADYFEMDKHVRAQGHRS